jgi:hypothetical protein
VQHGLIAGVLERTEDSPFVVRRVGEQRERVVGVRGDDDGVGAMHCAVRAEQLHPVGLARDGPDWRRRPHVSDGVRDLADV